jgi:hypothetical protein
MTKWDHFKTQIIKEEIKAMKEYINITGPSDLQTLTVGRFEENSITWGLDYSYQPPEDDIELLSLVKTYLAQYMNSVLDHPEELIEIITKQRDLEISALKDTNEKLEREVIDLRQELYDLRITLHTLVEDLRAEIDYKTKNHENK